MKTKLLSLLLIFIVASCSSSENDEPTMKFSYTGEFTETDYYQTVAEESFGPEQKIQFLIDNGVTYTKNSHGLLYNEPRAKQTISTYNLSVDGDVAFLQIDRIENELCDRTFADEIHYKFTPGVYEVERDGVPTGYHYVIYITQYQASYEYRLVGGNASVGEPVMTLELIDAGYKLLKNKEVQGDDVVELSRHSDTQSLSVSKDAENSLILKNGYYTFSFEPTAGLLVQTYPDFKEIGNLTKVK